MALPKAVFQIIIFTLTAAACATNIRAQDQNQIPDIGIAMDVKQDEVVYQAGYRYLLVSIPSFFSPRRVTEEQFQQNKKQLRALKTELYAANLFLPGELKLIGHVVPEQVILGYVDTVLARCAEAGVKVVVFGSSGARRIPEGYDRQKAIAELVSICRQFGRLAEKHRVIIALENLNSSEDNALTTLQDAMQVVSAVNNPWFRLNADIYHMMKEGESPDVIRQAKGLIVHCEIAEKEKRTAPGVKGDDFTPYFKALRDIGYKGKIFLECGWESVPRQAQSAYQYTRQQLESAWKREAEIAARISITDVLHHAAQPVAVIW